MLSETKKIVEGLAAITKTVESLGLVSEEIISLQVDAFGQALMLLYPRAFMRALVQAGHGPTVEYDSSAEHHHFSFAHDGIKFRTVIGIDCTDSPLFELVAKSESA